MGPFDSIMTDYERARQWRVRLGLSRKRLAELSGYSPSAIQYMEGGINPQTGRKIGHADFARYRLVCAAVAAGLVFDWDKIVIEPRLNKHTRFRRRVSLSLEKETKA